MVHESDAESRPLKRLKVEAVDMSCALPAKPKSEQILRTFPRPVVSALGSLCRNAVRTTAGHGPSEERSSDSSARERHARHGPLDHVAEYLTSRGFQFGYARRCLR